VHTHTTVRSLGQEISAPLSSIPGNRAISSPMSVFSAWPRTFVDIYPYEGGQFTLTGSQAGILTASVSKNIRSSGAGTFTLNLSPGGPNGTANGPWWEDILTPMSLVVIGMQRHAYSQIVMIGVVTSVTGSTAWMPGKGTQQGIQVSGEDFTNLFINNNFYLQLYQSMSPAAAAPGFLQGLKVGDTNTPPAQMGSIWYNNVMAGTSGIMSDVSFAFPITQTSRVTFNQLMATLFEVFPSSVEIPMGDTYLSSEGNWLQKFQEIFPFPWYELFVSTSPEGYYGPYQAKSPLSLTALPNAKPSSPCLIARVQPLPILPFNGGALPTSMDMTRFDGLFNYTPDSGGYNADVMSLSEDEVHNFYVLNPLGFTNLVGGGNANQVPFAWNHAAWIDIASIHRYGLKPRISELNWLYDPKGVAAKTQGQDAFTQLDNLVGQLALWQAGYFEPTPLMRKVAVTLELRPDILPGSTFTFAPRKDGIDWLFYIEGVTHEYTFGGTSATTLQLSRGLPVSVYSDQALLTAIHTGNAMLKNGEYTQGLPPLIGTGLQPVNSNSISSGLMGQIAGIFNTFQYNPAAQ
jgi:hypothetical protein